jgi:DHA1 family tetracycline resistance protein-like MFS transporter
MPRARPSLIPLFLTVCLDLVGFGILIPLMPYLALEFGASKSLVTGLNWSYSAAQFAMAPVWGRLSDRVGRRPVLLLSIGGSVASQLLFAGTQLWHGHFSAGVGLALLYFARIAAGAFAANISTAQAYIADVTTPENRAKGMGMLGAAFGLGFILGPALGGLLDRFGHYAPLLFAAALSAVNLVSAAFLLPETAARQERVVAREGRFALLWRGLSTALAPLLVLQFAIVFAFANMESTLALVLFDRFGWRAGQVGRLFAFAGVIMVLLQGVLTGRLAHRFGERVLLLAGMLAEATGMLAIPFAPAPLGIYASLGALAVGSGLCTPSLTSLISRRSAATEQGGTLGLAASLGSLGRIAGPMWGGLAYDRLGFPAPYLSAGVVLIASFVFGAVTLKRFVQTSLGPGAVADRSLF